MSEDNIVARAKRGDIDAFEALVRTHDKKVYSLAFRYTNNPQDAADISQEVFLRVFRAIGGFKEESSFSTWLYQITVNTCIDAVRRASRRPYQSLTHTDDEDGSTREEEIGDMTYSPEVRHERALLRDAIRAGIAQLSDEHRQILILRDINDMSYDEIGRILSLEPGTVKSRLFRAREKLRALLSENGNFKRPGTSKPAKER